jgi:ABC-2 type transport system ATP-binding protein
MIKFVNISKKFRNNFWEKEFQAVDNVSFEIKKGDLVGFLGANGAGKTTLIKILMDFSRQDNGTIEFAKELGESTSEIKSKIGYLPERPYLYQHLTGREFLKMSGELENLNEDLLKNLIVEWSQKLLIDHALDRKINTYSKGMQQRLGFMSALFHKPKVIILDEPLSGLDPVGRREFKKILKTLNSEGVTIFFSSHVVSDVEEICNKVVFIEKGKLIYEGPIDELIINNSSKMVSVKYFNESVLVIDHVNENEINEKILELINKGFKIQEIEKERPTLEEIIYKIKNE